MIGLGLGLVSDLELRGIHDFFWLQLGLGLRSISDPHSAVGVHDNTWVYIAIHEFTI